MKPSKRMIAFLQWMQSRQPVSMFPNEWAIMWKKARTNKFVEECGREPGQFGLSKFQLSQLGEDIVQRNRP